MLLVFLITFFIFCSCLANFSLKGYFSEKLINHMKEAENDPLAGDLFVKAGKVPCVKRVSHYTKDATYGNKYIGISYSGAKDLSPQYNLEERVEVLKTIYVWYIAPFLRYLA